jgi:hypothetical protein
MMINDESPEPQEPETLAGRLLAMSENSRELRGRLIERWARAETWDRVEGIALAWTLEPSGLDYDGLMRRQPETALPEEARHYLELSRRSFELSRKRITPARFMTWAHEVGLAFHPDWHRAINQAASRSQAPEPIRRTELLIRRWARAPYWSPEEGVALAYDLDPKEVIEYPATGYDRPRVRGHADAVHLLDLARRAIEVDALEARPGPMEFMKWSRSIGVEFHPDWWNAAADQQLRNTNRAEVAASSSTVPDLKTRERESLLKIVAGMAMAGYSWDPSAARSDAIKDIADDLERLGIPLDPGTIRKWLRMGAQLIPPQEEP